MADWGAVLGHGGRSPAAPSFPHAAKALQRRGMWPGIPATVLLATRTLGGGTGGRSVRPQDAAGPHVRRRARERDLRELEHGGGNGLKQRRLDLGGR
ncbi:unnamed protein product [Urochloa humidicola]